MGSDYSEQCYVGYIYETELKAQTVEKASAPGLNLTERLELVILNLHQMFMNSVHLVMFKLAVFCHRVKIYFQVAVFFTLMWFY